MKRLLLASIAAVTLCGPAHAANLTPDQLTAATTANNTDLLLIYPSGGPMRSVQWSVLKGLMQSALGSVYAQVGNNLSDMTSIPVARANLGLGTVSLLNTGTSGAAVPLLNGVNTWSGAQAFSGGLSGALTGNVTGNLTGNVSGNVTGALTGNVTGNVSGSSGSTTGNAATATALQTGRTIAITGDLTYTSPSFTGAGNVTAAGTLATVNSNVGSFGSSTSVPSFTVNAKGLVTAAGAASIPAASTGTAGLVALATAAQALAGTDTTHAVTPASLGGSYGAGAPGYYALPGTNGIYIEWGVTSTVSSTLTVTLPHTLTTGPYLVVLTAQTPSTGGGGYAAYGYSTTGFTADNHSAVATQFAWIAIGQ